MCEKNQPTTECRPLKYLTALSKSYPEVFRGADHFRVNRKGLPQWPDWCFFPLACWTSLLEGYRKNTSARHYSEAYSVAAVGTWRKTQGIYRYDPTLYESIIRTPLDGDLPHDILLRLPEWAVYIETPGMQWTGDRMHGFFAHLNWDDQRKMPDLRLVIDDEHGLSPLTLYLGPWSLEESIARTLSIAKSQWEMYGLPFGDGLDQSQQNTLAKEVTPLISLLLYLCTQNAEISSGSRVPSLPKPTRTKKGLRHFPQNKPTIWDVGVRLGAALRKGYQSQSDGNGDGTHASPRPHIRRAHWHGFRSGPRKLPDGNVVPLHDRAFELKWLPPIPVNLESPDDLPVTLYPVKDAA